MGKNYIIYCSGNASRVITFFNREENISRFLPKLVIFDGDDKKILEKLKTIFKDRLVWIDFNSLSEEKQKVINTYTSNFILSKMKGYEAEYLICFGKRIMKQALISTYPKHLINFHPSLLPAFKGINAIDQAFESKIKILGNTAHYINEQIDEGEIILQSAMLTTDFANYEDVLELQFPMLKIILRDLLDYEISDEDIDIEIKDRKSLYLLQARI